MKDGGYGKAKAFSKNVKDKLMKTKQKFEVLNSHYPLSTDELTKEELKSYFNNTWQLYEYLFSTIISDETFFRNPDPLRNPLIFYYGHTAAFYINKLRLAGSLNEPVNEEWDQLFAVGVDPDSPEALNFSSVWPTVEEVRNYRSRIYSIVNDVIDHLDQLPDSIDQKHPVWALLMAFEHDRIHFETSSVLFRQLPSHLLQKPDSWQYAPTYGNPSPNEWLQFEGGLVQLGKPKDSNIFGWDNEFGHLEKEVKAFEVSKQLISNMEYLNFVNSDNYNQREFWSEAGWAWKKKTGTVHPKFWVREGDLFFYRAIFDEIELPLDWPAEVNAYEAEAYLNWINNGSRLLTEAEFIFLSQKQIANNSDAYLNDNYNINFRYGSPTPVDFSKNNEHSINDLHGNVWDWLNDDFYALPGFQTHPWYEDFSAPFMDDEHGMMAGGSWATTGTGASKYYRLWFRRHFFQHAGFRLARSL